MNFLMLRGQVPTDRSPQEIVFDSLSEMDDMWTLLFYNLLREEDQGELWYWSGNREKKFTSNFTERWVQDYSKYKTEFNPDVIFCRGGFPQYHAVLKRYPKATKIYYGAGRRFLPQPGFLDYDIILQDSVQQLQISRSKFPNAKSILFIKPAADNLFYPEKVDKVYDICFPANGKQSFKGHDFVYKTVPKEFKVLNLGNKYRFNPPKNITSHRVLRPEMRQNIVKCSMGIVAVRSDIDSCPRVIPEMLACGIPVVVRAGVKFWTDKYIKSGYSGEIADDTHYWEAVRHVLNNLDKYNPAKYYKENLSLNIAGKFLRSEIDDIRI